MKSRSVSGHTPSHATKMAATKLEETKYTWFPGSPKLDGMRPTGPVRIASMIQPYSLLDVETACPNKLLTYSASSSIDANAVS